jgi:hypothetical protein
MRNSFTRVNLSCSGGQAFIESLYQQYADWGVDLGDETRLYAVSDNRI